MTPFASTLAALLALPIAHDDRANELKPAQYAALAHEISQLKPPRGVGSKDWRALVIAVGAAETHFLLRVTDGQCKPFECDRGLARSNWQLHQNGHTRPVWDQLQGFASLRVQVQTADKMLKTSYYTCANKSGLPWPQTTVLAFAGRGCNQRTIAQWSGLELRMRYFVKARQAMG